MFIGECLEFGIRVKLIATPFPCSPYAFNNASPYSQFPLIFMLENGTVKVAAACMDPAGEGLRLKLADTRDGFVGGDVTWAIDTELIPFSPGILAPIFRMIESLVLQPIPSGLSPKFRTGIAIGIHEREKLGV